MARIRRLCPQAGFTMIECLIAMALLAFIVSELGMVLSYASRNTNLSQRITRANALAEEAIEKSRNTAYVSLQLPNAALNETCVMAGFIASCTSDPDNGRFHRVRTVTPRDTSFPPNAMALVGSLKSDVDVVVHFTDSRGNDQDIRVSSIVAQR